VKEIEHAVRSGNLSEAIGLARDFARGHGRPIPLNSAAEILRLIARERPSEYDDYALRFLERWVNEKARTIDEAADLAAALAELPENPSIKLPM
jgi:hypothetical protein